MSDPRPSFTLAVDTRLLYERMKKAEIGETITYAELDAVIGRDVRNGAYSNFASARRKCERLHRIVFGTVQKVGIIRLDDAGIVGTAEAALRRVRRGARRAGERLTCVENFDALVEANQTKHNAALSLLSAVSKITQTGQLRRLEKHVAAAKTELPLAKTLKFFANG